MLNGSWICSSGEAQTFQPLVLPSPPGFPARPLCVLRTLFPDRAHILCLTKLLFRRSLLSFLLPHTSSAFSRSPQRKAGCVLEAAILLVSDPKPRFSTSCPHSESVIDSRSQLPFSDSPLLAPPVLIACSLFTTSNRPSLCFVFFHCCWQER